MLAASLTQCHDELFPDNTIKARVFDAFAERYYVQSSGTTQKVELDLLMFAFNLDQIYRMREDTRCYSDYTLSKGKGIARNCVCSLKDRKELKYPSKFVWKQALHDELKNAEADGTKIRIYLHDSRLYTELESIVKELSSYSEAAPTRQLLVVTPQVSVY